MRDRGRRFGVLAAIALATSLTVVAIPAGAAVTVPGAPPKPTATTGNARARVTWRAPASHGAAINQYMVTPYIGKKAQKSHLFKSAAKSQTITGLKNGTSYTFRVRAHNKAGFGKYSVASAALRVGTPVAPASPAVTRGNGTVRVNWVAPANNGAPVTGYVVTPFVGAAAKPARTFNSPALAEDLTGLVNGTAYTFRVAAKNARGVGPSSVASAAATPTAQPTLSAVMNTTIGQPILVDSNGMTVYLFVPDGAATTSTVTGALRTAWPYVTWGGALSVGAGLTVGSAAGNVQPDNTRLVSYNGHLLYLFVSDTKPGDVTGQGVNQFFVLDAAGNRIP